jgi:hypothetical protein
MTTGRRIDPLPLLGTALAVFASVVYLWLVQQKGDGRFEPAWWYVGLALIGAVEAALGAGLPQPRRRVVLGSASVTLLAAALLPGLALETSHTRALLGSVGLPLLGAAGACLLAALAPARRLLVPAAGVALLIVALAVPSASYLASHGEGVGGDSSAG